MKQVTEYQFGFERAQLDDLFTYSCGTPSPVAVFTHPGEDHVQRLPTHALMRPDDGFTITMYRNPGHESGIDGLPDELAFNIVRRWLDNGLIELQTDQSEGIYV